MFFNDDKIKLIDPNILSNQEITYLNEATDSVSPPSAQTVLKTEILLALIKSGASSKLIKHMYFNDLDKQKEQVKPIDTTLADDSFNKINKTKIIYQKMNEITFLQHDEIHLTEPYDIKNHWQTLGSEPASGMGLPTIAPEWVAAAQGAVSQDLPPMHEGPLNKTESTYLLEELLERLIAVNHLDDITLTIEHEAIEISVNGTAYSLTALLKNADFTHVFLSEAQITGIDRLLALTAHGQVDSPFAFRKQQAAIGLMNVDGTPFANLPRACLEAIYAYTAGDHLYVSMNALMHGNFYKLQQIQTSRIYSPVLQSAPLKDNILLLFSLNLLVHHALNALPEQLSENNRQHLASRTLLTRAEHFVKRYQKIKKSSKEDKRYAAKEVRDARINRVSLCATLTSTCERATSLCFPHYNTVTRFTNSPNAWPISRLSSCSDEKEVMLPASTQVYTTIDDRFSNEQTNLKATFVCSPDFQQDRYWPDYSFFHALTKYTTPYAEAPSQVIVNGRAIFRENHGAAHAYRKKLLVRHVFDYLLNHANHRGRETYATFTETMLQYLEIAAIRTGIGRESERPSLSYRIASKNHFLEFCHAHKPFRGLSDKERTYLESNIAFIIEIVGNPQYAAQIQAFSSSSSEQENLLRCIYHVLNLTHTLDLLRCYSAQEYQTKVAPYWGVSEQEATPNLVATSDIQTENFNELLRYSHDLMQAHGNAQMTTVEKGQLKTCALFYRSPFHRVSIHRRDLEIISEAVQPPMLHPRVPTAPL